MRSVGTVIAISLAIACTAVSAQQQTDPPAEQSFKNIKSFKGKKTSDIVPAMEFMSSSLGVGCDYCHAADRASDEKESKLTAREMIAMQTDINEKNFHGRTVVTCATCHAGHTHPVAVPPVTGADVRSRRSATVAVEQVLSAYAKALSGTATAPLTGIQLSGKSTSHGETSTIEVTQSGGKYLVVGQAKGGERKGGFDGSIAWFGTPQGTQKVPLEYAIQYVRESQIFYAPESLPKQDSPTGGTAKLDGRDMLTVTGNLSGTTSRASYFFDKETGLLARSVFYYPTILGSIEQINDYSNYQKVGGVQVPMKIVIHTSEGDTVEEFTTAKPWSGEASTFSAPSK